MTGTVFRVLLIVALPMGCFLRAFDYKYWEYVIDTYPELISKIKEAQLHDEAMESAALPPPLELVEDFPHGDVRLGQVSGVAVDQSGDIYVFHRADRPWAQDTFNGNVFNNPKQGPIQSNVILKLNKKTGEVTESFGSGKFYLPHGLTVDNDGNIWTTDVALHQVLKFEKGSQTPSLTLGEALVPGSDTSHFCKPTDVAVASNGEFFVADGYCNGRVLKYSATGTLLGQWGTRSTSNVATSDDDFNIPHSLTLVEGRDMICVADREHSRVQCFNAGLTDNNSTGEFMRSFHGGALGKMFAISYDPHGDVIYAVSGPNQSMRKAAGLTLDMAGTGVILEKWENFDEQPHDIAVSPDGIDLYVGLLSPPRLLEKFHRDVEDPMVG